VIPALSFVLEGAAPILKRLSATEQKAAVRVAWLAGAVWWIASYLVLRFTRYARAKLDYELHSSHIKRKQNYNAPDPLVWTGETRDAVLGNARPVVGGSAGEPWADIKMRTNAPRAPIVYRVLNTILDSEMPGVAKVIAATLQDLLAAAVSPGGRSKRLTLAGASSSLNSPQATAARTASAALADQRQGARDQAEDDRVRITEARPNARAKVQSRLKRTHDKWRRTSGGSAPIQGGGMSQTYAGSSRHAHAVAQSRHRARYR
jgi:hypothetical protein